MQGIWYFSATFNPDCMVQGCTEEASITSGLSLLLINFWAVFSNYVQKLTCLKCGIIHCQVWYCFNYYISNTIYSFNSNIAYFLREYSFRIMYSISTKNCYFIIILLQIFCKVVVSSIFINHHQSGVMI